jgi:hypothetical protein
MPTRIPLILILALATALIAAGCGDDDEETTTTAEATTTATGATGAVDVPPERAALVEEANAICAEGNREIDEVAQEEFGNSQQEPSQADQEAFFADTVLPSVQDQIDQLRELDPPDEDAEEYTGILDDAQQVVDDLEQDPSALSEGADPFAEVNERLTAFGLTECAG